MEFIRPFFIKIWLINMCVYGCFLTLKSNDIFFIIKSYVSLYACNRCNTYVKVFQIKQKKMKIYASSMYVRSFESEKPLLRKEGIIIFLHFFRQTIELSLVDIFSGYPSDQAPSFEGIRVEVFATRGDVKGDKGAN